MLIEDAVKLLQEEGCLKFLDKSAEEALKTIESICPEGTLLLSQEAKDMMKKNFRDRVLIVYMHPLMKQVRSLVMQIDPMEGIYMRGDNMDALKKAAGMTADLLGSEAGSVLAGKYPLIEEYEERIKTNFINSQVMLLKRLMLHRDEIAALVPGGRPFNRILELSADAGDIHRGGQCVQQIVTDTGAFYYKPHDLRADRMFYDLTKVCFLIAR